MKIINILFFVILATITSCSKIEIQTVVTDIYPIQVQFSKQYADSLGAEITKDCLPLELSGVFSVKGTSIYGDELFCANYSAKRIDIFDANTFKYKESIIDPSAPILSRDVYADDKYIYITGISNPRCQISIYDRITKKFICRLGNGSWAGAIVHAISVASSDKYVFVRDQSNKIKVFLKSDIAAGKSLGIYCYLNIDGQSVQSIDEYDMCVLDSILYAINIKNKTIYRYHTNTDYKKNEEVAYNSKFVYADASYPRSVAFSDKYLFIATNSSSAKINAYCRGRDQAEIDLAKPKFTISSLSGTTIARIDYIAAKGDTLFITPNDQKVTMAQIKIRYYDEIEDVEDESVE